MFASTSTIAKADLLPDGVVSQMQRSPYRPQLAGVRAAAARKIALQGARIDSQFLCVKCLPIGTRFFERLTGSRRQQPQGL